MSKISNKRRWNIALRIITLVVIFVTIIFTLPKSERFRYEYQIGGSWRYETLKAPFDFPVYKTEAELEAELESITQDQPPIFNFNPSIKGNQVGKLQAALEKFSGQLSDFHNKMIREELESIYDAGILQLPEKFTPEHTTYIKIIENNIGRDVELKNVYSLKSAYTTLVDLIEGLPLTTKRKELLLNMDLNRFIAINLDFDASKTNLELAEKIQNISKTQGMVRSGEVIINKDELVTQEKLKLLNSLRIEYQHNISSIGNLIWSIIGLGILTLAGLFIFSAYFYFFRKRSFFDNRDFIFQFSAFLVTVLLGSVSFYYNINIYAIPVLVMIIITNILVDKRSALYLLIGTSMLVALFAPNSYMYLFMQIIAGSVAILSLSHLQRRGQLFLAIALVFLTYSLVYTAFTFIQEGDFKLVHAFNLLALFINCILLSIAYLLIYIFERLFGFISEMTLIELSNPNHPALRELTKKAPGTFQHSLMVANLAEEAIYRIGGSPLLVRTGALYHDIGKAAEAMFFIENQAGGLNPHSKCDFDESAKHIIDHVTKGVALAKKYKLPESIVDFIRTHHGKSKVKFFYNSFKNKYPDAPVKEELFTYAGPDPSSKEHAVLMMADAAEAASRSLPEKTEENIRKLVNDIIDTQMQEGRFEFADITFRDIAVVKEVFIETLSTIYHSRIAYPKLNKEEQEDNDEKKPSAISTPKP